MATPNAQPDPAAVQQQYLENAAENPPDPPKVKPRDYEQTDESFEEPKTWFHPKLETRDPVDIENLPLYTPEGLVNCRDVEGKLWLKPGFVNILAGQTNSGKSYLFKWLMYEILANPKTMAPKIWSIQWIEAYSGSGKFTKDLDFLHRDIIQEDYNDARVKYIIKSSVEQMKKLAAEGKETCLPNGMLIMDDQIGSSDAKKATDMKHGEMNKTWEYIATRGA